MSPRAAPALPDPRTVRQLPATLRGLVERLRLWIRGNSVVLTRVEAVSLRWLAENVGIDALPCILSERGAARINIVVAPCERRVYPLAARILHHALVERAESMLARCDSYTCVDAHGRAYPDDYPAPSRCMALAGGDRCLLVYVEDAG